MTKPRPLGISLHGRRSRGVSLVVSLVLLLLVTLIAIGSMRGVALQVRMSGSTHDRSLAFQAAEAALREAEDRASLLTAADIPAGPCSQGICATPDLATPPRWLDDGFTGWRASAAAAPAQAPPHHAVIEDMGETANSASCAGQIPPIPNCITRHFRISARSTAEGRATVVVQSQFSAP